MLRAGASIRNYVLKEPVMNEDSKQEVDTDPAEFERGGEAEPKGAGEAAKPAHENPRHESATPLFLRGGPEGNKGNAQDEKDATGE